jgi:hypothetical protein
MKTKQNKTNKQTKNKQPKKKKKEKQKKKLDVSSTPRIRSQSFKAMFNIFQFQGG